MSKCKGYESARFRDHSQDYAASADLEDRTLPLYSLQEQVPRLPVPDLNETLELFLKSAQPHVTPAEFESTKKAVAEFGKAGGIGEVLQQRLLARAAEKKDSSWLQEWWNDFGYLSYRDSVVYNASYFLQFKNEFASAMASPTRRAARFVYHALEFRNLVVSGQLEPDMRKDKPMSNAQWKYMFNACRMPEDGMDFVRTYAPDLHLHIVVARKNRFYTFDVLDKDSNIMSIDAIQHQLKRIVKMADAAGADENPVGVLTTEHRDEWAKARRLVVSGPDKAANEASLERIQSSIFCVCLDDTTPTTREEIGRSLLHSDGKNRFNDKSWQFVFFENGVGGAVGEHSMMDGLTTTRFTNFFLEKVFNEPESTATHVDTDTPYNGSTPLAEPSECVFSLTEAAKNAVASAARNHHDVMATKELKVLMFHGYGKQKIKTFKTSPDAFAQLAIQLAYYKTFGVVRGTYESTQTRSFLHGRTEVTRSVSNESLAFCKAMTTSAAVTSPKEAHALLVAATQAHSSYIGRASNGKGCDRHLLGLKLLMKEGEQAAIFSDPAYTRSGHWALSTSGLVGELMDGWGFGEVVPDGIGIGYQVQNNRLRFTITSRHRWVDRITANLEQALLEMQRLCEEYTQVPKAKL